MKPKTPFWKIVSTMLLSYSLLELLIISSNSMPKIELAMDAGKARRVYNTRHLLFYELNQPDASLGTVPKPNTHIWYSYGEGYTSLSSDAFGFRNEGIRGEGAGIATVGDSFTMGYGLDSEQSWSSILGNLIGTETANYGVIGYGIWQYNKLLEEYSLFFRNKIVLYGIYANDFSKNSTDDSLANDFYAKEGWNRYKSSSPSNEELIKAIYSGKPFYHKTLTFKILSLLFPDIKKMRIKGGTVLFKHTSGPEVSDASEEGLERLCVSLEKTIRLTNDYNSDLVVLYFPSKNKLYRDRYEEAFGDDRIIQYEDAAASTLIEFFRKRRIPVVDFTKIFYEEERVKNRQVFMTNEFHLTAYGNRLVAEVLAPFVINEFSLHSHSTKGIECNVTTPGNVMQKR